MNMEKLVEIRKMIQNSGSTRKPDRDACRLWLYIFGGTRGGYTRLEIISLLCGLPMNANQISEKIRLDYKAMHHHLVTPTK